MIYIDIQDTFLSSYDKLPKDIKKKLQKQLAYLRDNPKHPSLKIHKIQGTDFFEFYIDIGYRCIFKQ